MWKCQFPNTKVKVSIIDYLKCWDDYFYQIKYKFYWSHMKSYMFYFKTSFPPCMFAGHLHDWCGSVGMVEESRQFKLAGTAWWLSLVFHYSQSTYLCLFLLSGKAVWKREPERMDCARHKQTRTQCGLDGAEAASPFLLICFSIVEVFLKCIESLIWINVSLYTLRLYSGANTWDLRLWCRRETLIKCLLQEHNIQGSSACSSCGLKLFCSSWLRVQKLLKLWIFPAVSPATVPHRAVSKMASTDFLEVFLDCLCVQQMSGNGWWRNGPCSSSHSYLGKTRL